ncbi:hypothetical protein AX17_003429 [Amanita inopinata Kibby_2008]|nr:hypothetical protein AX17_003429 [Amanita inopinata Kibby_2008]
MDDDRRKTFSSPIRQIPIEIMQKIFLHCLSDDEYTRPDVHSAPLLLAQVCSPWRRVALATPRLWNSLWMQLSCSNVERRLNTMSTWLQRSAACPLSLYAQVQSTGFDIANLFFLLLDAYRLRWKDLRLVLPSTWIEAALQVLEKGAPSLEVLRIRIARSQGNSTFQKPFTITDISAPRLRCLSWGITGSQRAVVLPQLSHLTELEVDYELSISECLDILRQCPNLETCEFWKIRNLPSVLESHSVFPIVLPRLRTFTLHSTPIGCTLLDYLTLPALTMLKIAISIDESDRNIWLQSSFNGFFARSSCSLQSLILQDALPSESALIQCLQCVSPSLTQLHLLDTRGIFVLRDDVLSLLTVRHGQDGSVYCLCPRLEVLRFGRSLLSTDGFLADMVESRWRQGDLSRHHITRLRSMNPSIGTVDHPQDVRRLTALREEGLHWS